MSVGQPQGMLLNEFGERLHAAFGDMAYHVGSSLNACVRIFGLESVSLDQWRALQEWVDGLRASPAGRAEEEQK